MASKSQQGFVLFEVMVSAAILSVGCLVLVESLQGSARAMRHVQESYEAALNAGNMLWMLDRDPETAAWKELVAPGSLRDLQWSVQSQSLEFPDIKSRMEAKTLTLQWQPAGPGKKRDSWTATHYALPENASKS